MREFLEAVSPTLASRLEIYSRARSLSSRASASKPRSRTPSKSRVPLPSGGSIVIHQTEALVAIDVNTGKFVGQGGPRGDRLRGQPRGGPGGRAADPAAGPGRAPRRRLHRHGGRRAPARALFERFEMELAQRPGAHPHPADLGVRPDRGHPPAFPRQPRAGSDARLPGMRRRGTRSQRHDGGAGSAARLARSARAVFGGGDACGSGPVRASHSF